jgi:hypothetical protein
MRPWCPFPGIAVSVDGERWHLIRPTFWLHDEYRRREMATLVIAGLLLWLRRRRQRRDRLRPAST